MIDRAAGRLGLMATEKISENEITAVDAKGMTEKTLMCVDDSRFARGAAEALRTSAPSYVCRIEKIEECEGKLILVSDDSGKRIERFSIYEAHAACCAALVFKDAGAVHGNLLQAVRRRGNRVRVFGLSSIEPYSIEGEMREIKAIEAMCGISAESLEKLREILAVRINAQEMLVMKAAEAERLRVSLLAQESFRNEWSSLEYINAGAYGFIFRAVSAVDGNEYALKVMCVGNDTDKLWKAKRESTNASQFYRSKYVVRTHDDGKIIIDGIKYIWISMELLEPIPCEISNEITVAKIACDVCLALEEIHKNGGMAHRDVKPANILRGRDNWKLCDFGITKEVQGRDMATVIGTSDFMAPELLRAVAANSDKANYDNSVDIYALGITMYMLLNRGAAPFMAVPPYISGALDQKNAGIRRIQGEQMPSAVNCSERLMKIIRKACSYKPADRYSSVSRMYDALEDFLEDFE